MPSKSKKTTWQKIRKLVNDVHLWLGLGSGLIVVAICFSGTVYVFNTELTEAAASHLYKVEPVPGKPRQPADAFIADVERVAGDRVVSVQVPQSGERSYRFNVKKEGDKSRFGTAYMVNPYTGEILGNSTEKNGVKEFMSTMFSLHRWLLLDKVETPIIDGLENRKLGSYISGTATIIFTLGCITGLAIWFPQKLRTWRQGLKIKWRANWKRLNHDLHNTLAFYSLIFLLVMGLTGPQWSFEWYREGLQKTLGTYKPKTEQASPNTGAGTGAGRGGERTRDGGANRGGEPNRGGETNRGSRDVAPTTPMLPIQIAGLLQIGDSELPYAGDYQITLPAKPDAPVSISKTRVGFFAPAAGDRLSIDPVSGKVLKVDIFRDKPLNERVAGSIKALHVGNVYGTFTKILYFLTCLVATSLPVTGTLIWINKLKKKRVVVRKISVTETERPSLA